MFCADYLDICDPVLAFDRIMEEIDVGQYLKAEPYSRMGRPGLQSSQNAEDDLIRLYGQRIRELKRTGRPMQSQYPVYVPDGL